MENGTDKKRKQAQDDDSDEDEIFVPIQGRKKEVVPVAFASDGESEGDEGSDGEEDQERSSDQDGLINTTTSTSKKDRISAKELPPSAVMASGNFPDKINPEYAERVKKQRKTNNKPQNQQGATDEYGTPPSFFKAINKHLGPFTLDAAATDFYHFCDTYFTQETDALKHSWGRHNVWCNPPYSRGVMEKFVIKAHAETTLGKCPRVTMLVINCSSSAWWHEIVMRHACEVWFLHGRLKFHLLANGQDEGPTKQTSAFHSVIVVFEKLRGGPPTFRSVSKEGEVYRI